MADMEVLMMEALKNLADLEFKFLKHMFHVVKYGDGKNIPFSELEKADFMDLSRKICSYYYPNQVQVLIDALKYVNRNDLAEKLRNQVETGKLQTLSSFNHGGGEFRKDFSTMNGSLVSRSCALLYQ